MDGSAFAVPVDGGRLSGRTLGTGDPLLVLHGGPGLSDYSEMLADELLGWRAICYTQRGPEPSPAPGPFSVAGHVADSLGVLDHLGIGQAVVLGHSWGAFLACCLAAAAPTRVRALVLIDGLGLVGDGGEAEFGAEMTARTPDDAKAAMTELDARALRGDGTADDLRESLRLAWPAYFADPQSAPPMVHDVQASIACYSQTFDSAREVLAAGAVAASLGSFAGPVEVVHGESSPMPVSASEHTAALFADAVLTTIPDAGHFLWTESAGAVAAALTRVERRLAAAADLVRGPVD